MRAPSLYTHFASKNAIYDAMFGACLDAIYEGLAEADSRSAPGRRARHALRTPGRSSTSRSPTPPATS